MPNTLYSPFVDRGVSLHLVPLGPMPKTESNELTLLHLAFVFAQCRNASANSISLWSVF